MNIPEELIFEQFELGPLQNFLYFIGDAKSREIAVVDPAWDVDFLCQKAKENGYKITNIFLTHGHADHVNGLDEMLSRHDVPVYISKHEASFYMPTHKNIVKVDDQQILTIGNIPFETIWTPGHSPGCQCFRYNDVLIAGDTIFIDGCGRCDLPGSDPKQMHHTLYDIVMKLPDTIQLFTGHNYGPVPYATLGDQKATNPYLLCHSKKEFLQQRMGISF